ncbi:MAG: YidC/Oxa1 family membrane protein insertase [Ruminococcaceae bacterium]|nr:YidC/Oxa1 family membrane protein insertase [Oscillospiraceae bacterium]
MQAILKFFGKLLSIFDSFTGSYLLALFIFALLVKLILLPFGIKQQKNSIKQAQVRPKEMAIRKKYHGRNDQRTQQKMQTEVMELYQQEGYNPASGCLPLLIQLPIILILYKVITNPLQYICGYSADMINRIAVYLNELGISGVAVKNGVFSGYDINLISYFKENLEGLNAALGELGQIDLSIIPNFSFFGLGGADYLAKTPSADIFSWLLLVPALNCVFTLLSTYVTRKLTFQPMQDNQSQGSMKFMNIFMTGMTTFIAFTVPAAIGIYWLFNNLLGMLQQFILAKTIPLPQFTEEDYKRAEKELLGKPANKKEIIQKTRVALARPMDDDEYADLGDYVSVYDERPAVEEPEPDGKSAIDKAPLKKKKK